MNIKHLALVLGAAALVASGGVGSVACSSSSSNSSSSSSSSGGSSSGGSSGSSSGSTADSGGDDSGSSSGGGDGGGSSGCKMDPSLHPGTAGSIFCGYTDAGAFNCMTGQQCCLGGKEGSGYAPEQCMTWGGTCTNGMGPLPIECEQPQDCAANGMTGAACFLQGNPSPPAPVAGCDPGDLISHGGSAIACEVAGSGGDGGSAGDGGAAEGGAAGACAAGELQVCEAPGDCPTGKTCTPIRWKLYQIGVCL